jgi:hypothetical protein
VVAELFAELMWALLRCVAEGLCYFSSRFLLPLFTGGRVTVMPYGRAGVSRWLAPYQRLPNGQIGVDGDFAVLIGLIFWIVVFAGVVLLLRGHG